jgi:hypothetical protein
MALDKIAEVVPARLSQHVTPHKVERPAREK